MDKTVDLIDLQGAVRRATFAQLRKVTPTEALLMTIPTNLRFGRQVKYLKSALPEVLQAIAMDSTEQQGSNSIGSPPPTQELTNTPRWITHRKSVVTKKRSKRKTVKGETPSLLKGRLHPQNLKKKNLK